MEAKELVLGVTLVLACWTDWREHKIYNKLLIPALGAALALSFWSGGWAGLARSLWGVGVGFSLLLIPYFLGGIGAGDVKLLAVIGAFGGPRFVVTACLYGAVGGGIIAAALLVRRRALWATVKHFVLFLPLFARWQDLSASVWAARQEKFPYGVALAAGAVLALALPLKGLS